MPGTAPVFCGVAFAMLVNYGINHLAISVVQKIKGNALPKGKPDIDDTALCTQKIVGNDYGEIEFIYKGKGYRLPAMPANETDIEDGEKVRAVHRKDDMVWVEKVAEEVEEVEDS